MTYSGCVIPYLLFGLNIKCFSLFCMNYSRCTENVLIIRVANSLKNGSPDGRIDFEITHQKINSPALGFIKNQFANQWWATAVSNPDGVAIAGI